MRRFTIGVDLGQVSDFTAFAVLEEMPDRVYHLRHLERFRDAPYPVLVSRLKALSSRLPARASLGVDATGVGKPVVNLVRRAGINASVRSITVTAGDSALTEGFDWRVPKRDLVSTVSVLLQTDRLRVSRRLRYAELLSKELFSFRARVSLAGSDTVEAWRERDHDDLVLAAALACWLSERIPRFNLEAWVEAMTRLDREEEEA